MIGTILTNTIVFFPTMKAAEEMATANGGPSEGFIAAPAKGREGKFVVEVRDVDDDIFLGYL